VPLEDEVPLEEVPPDEKVPLEKVVHQDEKKLWRGWCTWTGCLWTCCRASQLLKGDMCLRMVCGSRLAI
jgi:hypothetical protein